MISRSKLITLLLFLLITLTFIGTAAAAENPDRKPWEYWGYDKEKPVRGGTFVSAYVTNVGLFNANHWPINDWLSITMFYEGLFTPDGPKVSHPFLVESYEYTDTVTCVLKLRKGVKFHDGVDFDAYAVKTQMDYIRDKANGCWSRAWLEPVTSIEVVDSHTVKFKFDKPWVGFIGTIQDPPGWMISPKALNGDKLVNKVKKLAKAVKKTKKKAAKAKKKAAKGDEKAAGKAAKLTKELVKLEKDLREAEEKAKGLTSSDLLPVGTGPWVFDEYKSGNILKVKRNPNWWYGKSVGHPDMPYFDKRATVVIPDMSVQLANLRAGRIHQMNSLDKALYQKAKKNPDLKMSTSKLYLPIFLQINHNNKALKDPRVRKAITMAIDRKALIEGIFFGLAVPATSFMPHEHWARNQTLKPIEYNPEKARALLAEAGYKDGIKLTQGVVHNAYAPFATMVEPLKHMLSKVGIDWTYQIMDLAATQDKLTNLEYDLSPAGPLVSDPQTYFNTMYGPKGHSNQGRLKDENLAKMIETASSEMDFEKRKKIYHAIDKYLYDQTMDIYLYYDFEIKAFRATVRGFDSEMFSRWDRLYMATHPLWFKDGKE
jgi:peptide/nickel transport system substrate-binding protein